MTEGEPLQPNITEEEREEIRRTAQIIKETGISNDYLNEGLMVIVNTKTLLNKPGFELAESAYSEEKVRTNLLAEMKNLRSYSEYMAGKKKIKGIGLADFLTERGKQNTKRIDEITTEIKSLAIEDTKAINLEHLLTLLEEWLKLIKE
jgi:hypothetical protein